MIHTKVETLSAFVQSCLDGAGGCWFRGQGRNWGPLPALLREQNAPVDDGDLATCETAIVEEFSRRAPPRMTRPPGDWLEIITLLQQYGCPTRLLDWTGSALASLFFAVTSGPHDDGVVWVLDVSRTCGCVDHDRLLERVGMDVFDGHALDAWMASQDPPHELLPVNPRHVADRVAGQDAYFTLHRLSDPMREWDPSLLGRIDIPSAAKPRLFVELGRIGFSRASLFPDLQGLATQIGWERLGWRSRVRST